LRSFTAIRKEVGIFCGSFLEKGEVFASVGLSQNLKDLKDCGVVYQFVERFCGGDKNGVSELGFKML